jgi:hypothetical protein
MTQRQALRLVEKSPRAEFLLSRHAAGCSPATVAFYGYVLARFTECMAWPATAAACQRWFLTLRRDGCSEATIYQL